MGAALAPSLGSALNKMIAAKTKYPEWYKRRGYRHFDRPVRYERALEIVTDPIAVSQRSFWPFISFVITNRRFKANTDGMRVMNPKDRGIAYASHVDSHIFSYYSKLLSAPYEGQVRCRGIHWNVLAYRRFTPGKNNIHFACEAFQEIRRRGECVAAAMDIEQFFDTIPHDALKVAWARLLGVDRLPNDHFAVYKAVTGWSKVEKEVLYKALGISIHQSVPRPILPLCSPKEFRESVRGIGLLKEGWTTTKEHGTVGIPQGSPISALLSNIVLLEVDTKIQRSSEKYGVYYRRYCDDILLVGPDSAVSAIEKLLEGQLSCLGLKVNSSKTTRSKYKSAGTDSGKCDIPLQYLGFTYDGRRVLIRSSSVAKYYGRMKRGVRAAKRAARAAERAGKTGRVKRTELYARYSHLGLPTRIVQRKKSENKYARKNFYSYVRTSSEIMDSGAIRKQLRRHWELLHSELKKEKKK